MTKAISGRLEMLESVAQEKRQRREENAKSLYIKIVDNVALIWHDKKRIMQAASPFDAVAMAEDYLLQAKPEKVTISACLTGVLDLLPGVEEHAEFREMDTYYNMGSHCAMGDYYGLMESNNDITLANIFMCEMLYHQFRKTTADEEMGISFDIPEPARVLAHDVGLIMHVLLDRMRKTKAYAETHKPVPWMGDGRFTINRNEPSNRYSRYWPDEATREVCTHKYCYK